MAHEIFISYSAKDKEIAEVVCNALEAQNVDCWIAPRDISPGDKYAEAIMDGINQCRVFLLILSSSSNDSPQVEMEVDRAASKDVPILSFRIENVVLSKSMEYYLSSYHWLDASAPPMEKHIHTLIETAQQMLTPVQSHQTAPVPKINRRDAPKQAVPDKQSLPPAISSVRSTQAPSQTVTQSNPFSFGNPIHEPERFYGRKEEIRQIVNRLLSSAHESTSIIGERRIGKTSLLNYLTHPEVSARLGLTPDRFCLVYVDFQGLTDITPQRFWQRVLKKMSRSICDESLVPAVQKLSEQKDFDLFDLEDLFQISLDKGLTIVLLMDEFEYVTENPNFKSDFFGGLRALAIHHGLALIPATRRELVDLCHSDEIKGSPFFNIFADVVLRPFSRQDVDDLINGYTRSGKFPFASEEKEFMWELGGGYPLFAQMAGYYLFEGKLQSLEGEALRKFVTSNFGQQADAHYSYLWSRCSESEKTTLLIIMLLSLQKASKKTVSNLENLAKLHPRARQDVIALDKCGLLNECQGVYALFSSAFERWVRQDVLAASDEADGQAAADEWIRSGGRQESTKMAGSLLPRFKKKYWPVLIGTIKGLSLEFAAADVPDLIGVLA